MIDKMTDNVSYAVLSFGGFLGIGNDHHRLRFSKIDTHFQEGAQPKSPHWNCGIASNTSSAQP
jgi:hypothetical protein